MSEKVYRDPVHDMIRIKTDTDEGELLSRLIDTAEFQRLRRIKQLGLAHYTYPGAEHSRFTHSLGAMHLACRILDKLSAKYLIPEEDQLIVKCAALLHDIGHGAFSHVLEAILNFHHEDFTVATILSAETEIGQKMREFSTDLPEKVASAVRGHFKPKVLAQLISSQLDVDRMDYLLRDSYMTGVKYGVYDLEWIIESLEIDDENDRIYISAKGIHAVEDYLQARHYMFKQVYFHQNLRSAEAVLRSLFRRALDLMQQDEPVWCAPETPFERILKGERLSLIEHLQIDDSDMLFHVKKWQFSEDKILSDLAKRFINRRFFKSLNLDMDEELKAELLDMARREVKKAGFDEKYYFVEDKAGDMPYYPYTETRESKNAIFVEVGYSNPQIKEISEVSPAVRGLQKAYEIHRVCFPPEVKDSIECLYKNESKTRSA